MGVCEHAAVADDCIFCGIVRGDIPAIKVDEDEHTVAFMDIAPWHRGHALVIPRRHVRDVGEASPDDVAHVLRAAQRLAGRMRDRLGHGDVTLANAMGEAAGQTVFHFHVHVVPGLEVDVARRAPEPGELEEIAAKLR